MEWTKRRIVTQWIWQVVASMAHHKFWLMLETFVAVDVRDIYSLLLRTRGVYMKVPEEAAIRA
jgi:hypothetical protein